MSKIDEVKRLAHLTKQVFTEFGPKLVAIKGYNYVKRKMSRSRPANKLADVLFINGTTLPHPERFRVDHQMEQLESQGLSCDKVFYEQLDLAMVNRYRCFVFFRTPATDLIREFIPCAKSLNKVVFFDIDDLVIDAKYTELIPYVHTMPPGEKAGYDDGVNRMRETLLLCDHVITTTEALAGELETYVPDVFVNRNVASDELVEHSAAALEAVGRDPDHVVIGYFSGSITHNSDYAMVLPALRQLLDEDAKVRLRIVGILDVPDELKGYGDRVEALDFMDWRKMPTALAGCDIQIAPLTDTIFNQAKSENKWVEGALVKVATAASNLGAFRHEIEDGVTGVLVEPDGWLDALRDLVSHPDKRTAIAEAAYQEVIQHRTTLKTGRSLAEHIRSILPRHIGYVLPTADVSGGVNVILKHVDFLQEQGCHVSIINQVDAGALKTSRRLDPDRYNEVVEHQTMVVCNFDLLIGSLWTTVETVQHYPRKLEGGYFVQNFEVDFLPSGDAERINASAHYATPRLRYLTMSPWCVKWLKELYGQDARLACNGIDLANYPVRERDFTGKVKVLVEGDSRDFNKNVDEAFTVTNGLDPAKFEIGYLSYRHAAKDWYRVDNFFNKVPPEEVGQVYAKYDILLKTSTLESFSYPPLEMMATGGFVVVRPNDGNAEYVEDGVNCLTYTGGDPQTAVAAIERLAAEPKLRETLRNGGLATAARYSWDERKADVLRLYE
ncbi:MAG: glycosyltransferase family 4 protein [Propionibacteriaceae bacterium]|jgi:glycosyltransferase involved in cell wall biosynthesis|nr:glycosyltransferase family 4 protein [Propionibacteriaceae bacterium]